MKNKVIKNTKILTILALCVAITVSFRIMANFALGFLPNFQPMTVIVIFIGIIMGPALGVIHVALAVFLSNLILGSGLWTIWQICTYALIVLMGCFVNFILEKILKNKNPMLKTVVLLVFCVLSGFIYGFFISLADVLMFGTKSFITYYLAGIVFDGFHAVGNGVFFAVLYPTLFKVIKENYEKYKQ